ncbi:hypothetical protein IFM89_033202, partial [Coptis chinensis]
DMSLQPPTQELVAKDLHGIEWRFRPISRSTKTTLAYNWLEYISILVRFKGVNNCVRRREWRTLCRVRRAIKPQKNVTASVISNHSMQLGILTSASHAISTGSMFSVYYRPRSEVVNFDAEDLFSSKTTNFFISCRTSPYEFIVPYAQYMKSIEINYSVGMRFTMELEGEHSLEHRWTSKETLFVVNGLAKAMPLVAKILNHLGGLVQHGDL